jgi:tetratricopeptide (TPR) repeat protein
MRARQELGELLSVADKLEDAIAIYERMLELNPNDNQGVRYALVGLYLATKRGQAASDLLSRYPGEEDYTAVFAWGRVIERWLASREADAQSALLKARTVNPFVERYLAGTRKPPERLPSSFRPGDDSEAQVAAAELSPARVRLPEFTAWLRKQQ